MLHVYPHVLDKLSSTFEISLARCVNGDFGRMNVTISDLSPKEKF